MTSDWRDPKSAPEDDVVLLALDSGEYAVGYWSSTASPEGAWFFAEGLNSIIPPPIAWLPLPEHPVQRGR